MTQEEVVAAVVEALEELAIAYMVAGSFASNFHGIPRMTQDADIVIDVDEAAALRLAASLADAFYVSGEAVREAVQYRKLFNVIHFDSGFKVDLIVKKARSFSDEELRRRSSGTLAGRQVAFATAEDTVLAKLEWAKLGDSERQYSDAVGVIEVQETTLDWAYLERWADDLGLTELLAKARRKDPYR